MKQTWNHIKNTVNVNWGRLGIQRKIMLFFFGFALLVVLLAGVYLTLSAEASIREEKTDTLLEILDQTAINVDYTFNQVEDTCFRMRTDWDLVDIYDRDKDNYEYRQQNRDYYSLMDIYSSNMVNRNIGDIRLYMDNGGFYLNLDWICKPIETVYEQSWYPLDAEDQYRWVNYYDASDGQPVFTISCVRTLVRDSKTVGYIEMKLNRSRLYEILEDVSKNISSNIYVLNKDGIVYAASDETVSGEPFRYQQEVRLLLNLDQNAMELEDTNSELLIYEKENLVIAAVVPEKVLLQGISDFWISSISVILVVLVIAMALSQILSSSITKRIQELCKSLETLSIEGDTLLPERSNDEITQLARNTNEMIRMNRKLLNDVYLVRLAKREAELSALQAQINPHFLYNTLDAINWMANRYHATDVSQMTRLLAKYFRLTLSQGKRIITIRDELEHVRVYLEIMQVRCSGAVQYSLDVDEQLQERKVVKLLLQPIVENAILHGLMERSESGGQIDIRAERRDNKIILSVTDNGVGIPAETLERVRQWQPLSNQKGGYGLSNVNSRIQLYYGPQYGLRIDSEVGKGTTVEVHLPDVKE